MGVLSDSKILEKIDGGELTITPFDRKRLNANSYDLSLHNKLILYTDDVLDPKREASTVLVEIPESGIVLEPGVLYLGVTRESLTLKNVVGVLSGTSGVSRLGLSIHVASCVTQVGFSGFLTLEIIASHRIRLYPGMLIGQILFEEVSGFVLNPYTKKEGLYNNEDMLPMKSLLFKRFKEQRKESVGDSGISFTDENLS